VSRTARQAAAVAYVRRPEELVDVPIALLSTGPDREGHVPNGHRLTGAVLQETTCESAFAGREPCGPITGAEKGDGRRQIGGCDPYRPLPIAFATYCDRRIVVRAVVSPHRKLPDNKRVDACPVFSTLL
jgi:hypothetical protein